ncbi:hypothetical protein NARC_80105 [Candidatus Nitrosocosmicus arcticus]|uniref:Uncharacterized protein n=1 Tax=Candidatus Nitrosocosmicus arcticus TaxID=2035267 RepID=A0A557SUU8_9ARCH|nr:hypothetical protein NARC_80105 [Candidatus Nitrosocosmicus arcticus]
MIAKVLSPFQDSLLIMKLPNTIINNVQSYANILMNSIFARY